MVLDVATGGANGGCLSVTREGDWPDAPTDAARKEGGLVGRPCIGDVFEPVQPSSQSFGLLRLKKVWCNPLNLSTRCLPASG